MNFKISLRRVGLLAFALLAAVGLLEGFLRLGGEVFYLDQEKVNRVALARRGSYVILCLGESMTAGGGLSSYPRQLEDTLNSLGLAKPVAVVNLGVPSANSGMIVAALAENLDAYRPDAVVVMMGVNDELKPLDLAGGGTAEGTHPLLEESRAYEFIRDTARNLLARAGLGDGPAAGKAEPAAPDPAAALDDYRKRMVNFYLKQGDWNFEDDQDIPLHRRQAVAFYEKALALNPALPSAILNLGISHRELGEWTAARARLEEAARFSAQRYRALIELGNLSRARGDGAEAEQRYAEAIHLRPDLAVAWTEWSRLHQSRREWKDAVACLANALAAEPTNRLPYQEAEKIIAEKEARGEAERALKEALGEAPLSISLNMLLADLYEREGRPSEAEALYRRTIDRNPEAFWAYTALGNLCRRQGKDEEARALYREADKRRLHHNATALNYRRLKEIVRARGIALVCVQYPLVPVKELAGMVGAQEGVTFVDNERAFQEAIRDKPFDQYFTSPIFPGHEFGHCTPRGNRLLAENIARALLSGPLRGLAAADSLARLESLRDDSAPGKNLLAAPSVAVSAVSVDGSGKETDRLKVETAGNGRRFLLERYGEATRVRVDFGAGRGPVIKAVASHHPQDPHHLVMEVHYFQGAEIYGSSDGVSWRLVGPADHREYPGEEGWRIWSFDNETPFRFYELRIPASAYAGSESYFRRVNELAFFEEPRP